MTAFSDFPAPPDHPVHPAATQVHAYLRDYAERFGVTRRIRLDSPVREVRAGWTVDGEPFDAVVVASGRFRRPALPPGAGDASRGEVLHSFDYPGAEALRDRATLVVGSGISGLEIASDLAPVAPVVSSFRKQRYVIRKIVDGVLSDWRWFTLYGALERRLLDRDELGRRLRDRIAARRRARRPTSARPHPTRTSSSRASRSARTTSRRSRTAASRAGPRSPSIDGRTVTFADGSERELRRDRLRDGLRPRRSLPRRRGSPGCSGPSSPSPTERSTPTSPVSASSGSTWPRAPTSRSSSSRRGWLGRRLVRRRRAARRRRPPPCARRARPAARGAQRARRDAGRAGRRRARPGGAARARRAAPLRPDAPAAVPPGRTGRAGRGARRGSASSSRRPRARRSTPRTSRSSARSGSRRSRTRSAA